VATYRQEIENINPESIVYIDEMGIDTFIYRAYAYSKRGVKVVGRISGKKYKRTSIVAAKLGKNIIAPLQYGGSMDARLFEQWFEFCLIPLLPPNSTTALDNASFHNKKRLNSLAKEYGHEIIFLPPYSPELNEIENFWGWLKCTLKKVIHIFDNFDDALRYCFNII
jgi:transposase